MLIGDKDYAIDEFALFIVLIVSIIGATLLFLRGHNSYSVKYELMRKHVFFRVNRRITNIIQYIYKAFFLLPFVLVITIAIIRATKQWRQAISLLINGLVILLILYPTKNQYFYIKLIGSWVLIVIAQATTKFLYINDAEDYFDLSVIFYTINYVLFSLALISRERSYWQISQPISKYPQKIKEVNQKWSQSGENVPKIFDGGLYGLFYRLNSYTLFLILYLSSLGVLGLYAGLVWILDKSYLGIIGMVSNTVYDIFVMAFSTLAEKQRSLTRIILIIFFGRFMSFIFGSSLWLIGYCVLYFGIGSFIGILIVDRRLPMKFPNMQQVRQIQKVNAFKTPQFVLILLTVLIIVLIVISYLLNLSPTLKHNEKQLPLWQIGLIAVFATWIFIAYQFSLRMLQRHVARIRDIVQYYFGIAQINQYQIYVLLTYVMVIGFGLYWKLYFGDTIVLIGCIFIPLIYLDLLAILVQWVKNQYQILADIEDYNKRAKKKYDIHIKKQMVLNKRKLRDLQQNKDQQLDLQNIGSLNNRVLMKNMKMELNQQHQQSQIKIKKGIDQEQTQGKFQEKQVPQHEAFQELKDWRNPDNNIGLIQLWGYLTPNDKKIIFCALILLILFVGISVSGYLWAGTDQGLSFSLCIISYLTMLPYYRCAKCGNQILLGQLITTFIGYILGIVYWSVLNNYIYGPIIWACLYIIFSAVLMGIGIKKDLEKKIAVIQLIKIVLNIIFICIILGLYFPIPVVVATVVIISMIGFGLLGLFFMIKYQHVPLPITIIITLVVAGGIIGLAVGGFILDIVSDFAVFTIITGLIEVSLLVVSAIIYLKKRNSEYDNPHVYSAYGYPIYRFQSAKQVLKSSTNHMVIFSAAMVVLIAYSVIVIIIFDSKQYSIYALSIFLCIQFFIVMTVTSSTYYSLGLRRQYLTDQLIMQSYQQLIGKYMLDQTQGQDSAYYKQKKQQKLQIAQRDGDQTGNLYKQIVYYHDLMVQNQQQQQKFLFYWIVLIDYHLHAKKRQLIITSLNQLKQIQQQLLDSGIFLTQLNTPLPPQVKYKKINKQLQSLMPLDYIIYQEILRIHKNNKGKKQVQLHALHKKQQQKNNQRDHQLFKKLNQEDAQPINQIQKFNQLVNGLGKKGLFTDQDFPANQKSLGVLASKVQEWRRPSIGEMFSKQGINAGDVKQGDIGDCYLISSFGVLGEQRILSCIGIQNGKQLWKNTKGAYMVKFYKFLKQVYVVIDDQLPVNSQGQWIFAKSQDPSQFWPTILEKAYAKLYSGYDNIIEGKCHRVLAQFTGGFPFEILLETYKNNPNGLWTKIMSGKNNGYLLAAGTPSNPSGDLAVSKRGIVQGHAYSILDARQAQGYKVIKLKNPHGSAGRQWIGDFSDKSQLMSKRMMGLLNHTQKDDGIFWMPLQDFIYEFKSFYICAVFDSNWKKIPPFQGEWNVENSFGTPNLSAQTYKNPQFGLTVSKRSIVFINLTQQAESALKGKNYIYLRVQRNNGKRMHQQDIVSSKLCGPPLRPINSVSLSTQIQLEADSYPYTFTILVCTKNQGELGRYTLQIFCNDLAAEIIPDSKFDR